MTSPLLCFLIASRKRVDGLLRTLESIRTHPDSDRFEIRVWFDNDDLESLSRADEIEDMYVSIHTGPRDKGYASIGHFITTMANESMAKWIITCDDDNVVQGRSFADFLDIQPSTGVFCTPEIYTLHNCSYTTGFHQYGIIPNQSWKCESPEIGNPTDTWLWVVLVKKRGWRMVRIPGFEMYHDWSPRINLS